MFTPERRGKTRHCIEQLSPPPATPPPRLGSPWLTQTPTTDGDDDSNARANAILRLELRGTCCDLQEARRDLRSCQAELLAELPTLSRYTQVRVDLPPCSARYQAVKQLFLESVVPMQQRRNPLATPSPARPTSAGPDHLAVKMDLEVLGIERLLSRSLVDMYLLRRAQIEGLRQESCPPPPADFSATAEALRLPPSPDPNVPDLNEYLLFHGSSADAIDEISRSGFDPRRGGESSGRIFGHATYFAPNVSKADYYAGKAEDAGYRCMILARVCLGAVAAAHSPAPSAMRPDTAVGAREGSADSVVALTKRFGGCVDVPEAMIYSESQALPEYVVTYRHKPSCQCQRCN